MVIKYCTMSRWPSLQAAIKGVVPLILAEVIAFTSVELRPESDVLKHCHQVSKLKLITVLQ